MIYTDEQIIAIADQLLADDWISQEERDDLITCENGTKIWDDMNFIVAVCDSGDVVIHNRGAYPYVLKGYASNYLATHPQEK